MVNDLLWAEWMYNDAETEAEKEKTYAEFYDKRHAIIDALCDALWLRASKQRRRQVSRARVKQR